MAQALKNDFDVDRDIPDLFGKVILITGGNAGIGKAVCLNLAKHNPQRIYIAARNPITSEEAITELKRMVPKVIVTFIECNLRSLESVKKAAEQIISSATRLDLLFCNAGILGAPPGLTDDGYEIHFGVNHLGHALLIKLLMPMLLKTAELYSDIRVVSTTSDGYRFHAAQGIVFTDLSTRQENLTLIGMFGGWLRYFQSKLANILYITELARHYPSITFVAVHPGIVDTPLTPSWIKSTAIMRRLAAGGDLKTADEGSFNLLWAGTGRGVVSGEYYESIGVLGKRTPKSRDLKLAGDLWKWTSKQLEKYSG